jgi:hypothetical protein
MINNVNRPTNQSITCSNNLSIDPFSHRNNFAMSLHWIKP